MIQTRFRFALLTACMLMSALFTSSALAQDSGNTLEGRWNLIVSGPSGDYPAWIEIRRSGRAALVGSYVGQFGSARPIGKIEVRENGFRFVVPPQWEARKEDIVFEGTLSGEQLSGDTVGEKGETLKWKGTRAPELKREKQPEWSEPKELFNGKDTTGWKMRYADRENGWIVKNGILINEKPGNDIVSEAKFEDFKLIAEFRYPKGSNSGIYLRGRYEVQIEDNFGEQADSHKIGGVYGHLTPSINASKPAGEWQTAEITLVGRVVTVFLNGERIIDRQTIPGNTGGGLDNDEASPGPILIQGDHGPVEFRRVAISTAK
jgi:Domain of Unknown Function (DUF1080)